MKKTHILLHFYCSRKSKSKHRRIENEGLSNHYFDTGALKINSFQKITLSLYAIRTTYNNILRYKVILYNKIGYAATIHKQAFCLL